MITTPSRQDGPAFAAAVPQADEQLFPSPPGTPAVTGKQDRSSWPKALTDGFATWSLVASLFGFSAIGIILGAIHASNAHKQQQRASSVAAWGIGIGIASAVAWTILWIVLIAAMAAASHASYSSPYGY